MSKSASNFEKSIQEAIDLGRHQMDMMNMVEERFEAFIIIAIISGKDEKWVEERLERHDRGDNRRQEPPIRKNYQDFIDECYRNEGMPKGGYLENSADDW